MKLRYFILLLLTVTLLTTGVFATSESTYLWDEANVFSDKEEKSLNQELAEISRKLGIQVMAATVSDEATYGVEALGDAFFAEHSSSNDGVILFLAFGEIDNGYYVCAQGSTQTIFTEKVYDKVENSFVPYLRSKEYAEAVSAYAQACDKEISSYGKLPWKGVVLCVVIGVLLSFLIPMSILKRQLKSVRHQPAASSYVQENSLRLRRKTDTFLYRNVSRVAKPKNTSSGGGGRSGGGGHRGRSGKF